MSEQEVLRMGWGGRTTAGVASKHLQDAYTVLQKSLQQEWEFMQRATQGLWGRLFAGGEGPPRVVPPRPIIRGAGAHARLDNH